MVAVRSGSPRRLDNVIRLVAAAVVGYLAITGRSVDPLVLAAVLSAFAAAPPDDADHATTDQETSND